MTVAATTRKARDRGSRAGGGGGSTSTPSSAPIPPLPLLFFSPAELICIRGSGGLHQRRPFVGERGESKQDSGRRRPNSCRQSSQQRGRESKGGEGNLHKPARLSPSAQRRRCDRTSAPVECKPRTRNSLCMASVVEMALPCYPS